MRKLTEILLFTIIDITSSCGSKIAKQTLEEYNKTFEQIEYSL